MIEALIGGGLIGLAATTLLFFSGRIAGISGIFGGLLRPTEQGDRLWRVTFVLGLSLGGFAMLQIQPELFHNEAPRSVPILVVSGFLVGFGTRLGSGCTSGHGVCGVSRLSRRSIVATLTFIGSGMLTVLCLRWIGMS